jgi:glycosyltransferase involved in cell wall biosynthesis
MKVSLVATVKDARGEIEMFLESVRGQTRRPDEVVVVDGGSTDGTWEVLEAVPGIVAISEAGAGIGRGRNLAIRAAAHDVIAVSDADCVLAPDWLERILEPIERGADVAAGFYRPLARTFFQTCAAATHVPDPDELHPDWMPSSRSIAFRREAWVAAGGYPEWLEVGEDMYLNHRLRDVGMHSELAPRAVTWWPVRPTLAATWRQYSRYAEGDATAGMYPRRHLLRFATYGFLAAALVSRDRRLLAVAAIGGAAHTRRPVRRAWRRLDRPADRAKALAAVPALMAFTDVAKMWGYVRGRARRRTARNLVRPGRTSPTGASAASLPPRGGV